MKHIVIALILVGCGDDATSSTKDDANNAVDDSNGGGGGDSNGSGSADAAIDAPGGSMGVTCGTTSCTTGQKCCTTFNGGGGGSTSTCVAMADACQGISTSCDGPEDCSGTDKCCANGGGGGGGGGGVACTPAAGQCQIELCHVPSDCATAGDMCCTTQFGNYCAAMCF